MDTPLVINSVQDLIGAATWAVNRFSCEELWWRGQWDSTWSVVPGVHRRGIVDHGVYERNLLARFQRRAIPRIGGDRIPSNSFEWLFLAQHHGLPTRLLDWTASPLFALYFAVCRQIPSGNGAAVYALDPFRLNQVLNEQHCLFGAGNKTVRDRLQAAFRDTTCQSDAPAALNSSETNLRMQVQLSCFTVHATAQPLESCDQNGLYLARFHVPNFAHNQIKAQLGGLGVTRSNLFPDLYNLARDLSALEFRLEPPPLPVAQIPRPIPTNVIQETSGTSSIAEYRDYSIPVDGTEDEKVVTDRIKSKSPSQSDT
jgi:hypothetical protein